MSDLVEVIIKAVKTKQLKQNEPYFITGSKSPTVEDVIDQCTPYPFKSIKIRIPTVVITPISAVFEKLYPGASLKNFLTKQKEFYEFDLTKSRKDFGYDPMEICEVINRKTISVKT